MQRADQLRRELTPEEMAMILAADVYAHRNWHNLVSSETKLVEMLERAGYLTPCSQGFMGRACLPNSVLEKPKAPITAKDHEKGT